VTTAGSGSRRWIAAQLAEFAAGAALDALPPEIPRRAKAHVLDTLAGAIAAGNEPSTRALLRALDGALGDEATILGRASRTQAEVAALANGAMAHSLELDDDHRLATLHPGAVIVPAALAASEAAGASGERFLLAVILGYEVTCRVGEAFLGRQFYRGFHPTATCGVFGAAVAASVAWDLTQEQIVNALGIAGSQAAGLGEWRFDGSWTKRLHPGLAAQGGILSARLAREGFTGPASVFEGESGFLRAFRFNDTIDADAITRGLGTDFRMMKTAFKPYPGCRFAHGAIDLAISLHDDGMTPETIREIAVRTFRTDILNQEARPQTPVVAQFSVPYLTAAALAGGSLGLGDLTPAAIERPEVLALSSRISMTEDDEFTAAYPERYLTELRVTLSDGQERTVTTDCPRGDPDAADYAAGDGRFEREISDKVRGVLDYVHAGDHGPSLDRSVADIDRAASVSSIAEILALPITASKVTLA